MRVNMADRADQSRVCISAIHVKDLRCARLVGLETLHAVP